jgi:DNA-binding FadR family transcriptional regulator
MVDRVQSNEGYVRVRDYLANAIKEHAFAPGDRLPTERQLAEQFAISRAITRRALGELEAAGIIRRQVGRGTFVRPTEKLTDETTVHEGAISPAEYIEVRLRFEPELAWLIATNGTAADFERMEDCLKRGESASTFEDFELWDSAFHQSVAAATHNKLAIHMYEMIHSVRHEQAMWGTLRQRSKLSERRPTYQREHREIFDALKHRDAESARSLIIEHIRATRRRLLDF